MAAASNRSQALPAMGSMRQVRWAISRGAYSLRVVVLEAPITVPLVGRLLSRRCQRMPVLTSTIVHKCGARLTPKAGERCVFCSYADSPCPPIQTLNTENA